MRITVIADPIVPVPPAGYGGTERVVHSLCEGLHKRGHEMTLLAGPGSRGPWKIVEHRAPNNTSFFSRAYRKILFQLVSLRHTAGRDLVISFGRFDYLWALLRAGSNVMHVFQAPVGAGELDFIPPRACVHLVSLSDSQRAHIKSGNWSTIYNSVPVAKMEFSAAPGEYLAFLGRLHPEKGAHIAIQIAKAANQPLVIAGNVPDDEECRAYFENEIRPHLGDSIRWIGEVEDEKKGEFLRRASALLFPIQWDEPFGLVVAESFASGTPVIALGRGSIPEIVIDGVTGFICDSVDEMIAAAGRVDTLNRARCRTEAERRFSEDVMVERYLDVAQRHFVIKPARPKRVLLLADPMIPVPPSGYGGAERIVYLLAKGLHERGHLVILFAAPGSTGQWRIVTHRPPDNHSFFSRAFRKILFQLLSVYHGLTADLIIAFCRPDYLWALRHLRRPIIQRFGNELGEGDAPYFRAAKLVSISNAQRAGAPGNGAWTTIYNAVPLEEFEPRLQSHGEDKGYLAFLGRLHPNKGAHRAIEIAQRSGHRLLLGGNIPDDGISRDYFEREIRPKLNGQIQWLGELDHVQKNRLLKDASALLFPIEWDEPFGIVMIEALACGTPVIAARRGSVAEIVDDGVTGFICDDDASMARAVARLSEIDRAACRRAVERRFSEKTMIDAYLALSQAEFV